MKRRAYRSLPDSLKPIARRGYDAAVIGYFALNDVFDFLRGNHDDASPPKWMIAKYKTGSADFRK